MKSQVKSLKKLAKAYFICMGVGVVLILIAGFTTSPVLGPIAAILGLGSGLVANVMAVFIIPIKVLTIGEK